MPGGTGAPSGMSRKSMSRGARPLLESPWKSYQRCGVHSVAP
uniref:Uncharacterized protein n=1 Tax=Anguilla anguilla TaxID=7936 RepID=A0A0E9VZA3_ANGAN